MQGENKMEKIYEAIKSMSEHGYAVVEDELIEEVSKIFNGLGVKYQIVKVEEKYSSLVMD